MKPFTGGMAALLCLAGIAPATAAPAIYKLDPTHTFPSLEFSHMGISVWRGKFDRSSGTVTLDRTAKTGTVDVVVDTASINFGLKEMDAHAVSPDWFDAERYPTVTYKGSIQFDGDKPKTVKGDFTFRGLTRPLTLTLNSFNCIPHPILKREVCGADAEGTLNWSEYGMKHSDYGKGEAGEVLLRIQVEGIRQE